jgi:hypothetical protein
MALLKVEAEKMSNNQLVAGLIEELITVNEVYGLLPFTQVSGKAYVYHREDSANMPTVSFIDPLEAVPEDAGMYIELVTKLRILAGDVDVDKFLVETMGDSNDQLATALALKVKVMGRTFQDAVVNGSNAGNAKQFDGVKSMSALATAGQAANAAQTIVAGATANGDALTLTMLDKLVDQVPNKPDFLMMRSGTRRAFVTQLRLAGGNTGSMLQHPNFDMPILAHNGVPVLINDWIGLETKGADATNTSIYAVRANEADGLHGLYGGSDAGFRVESIGTVQNKDATRTRVKWYCGLALKSSRSLARLSGTTNS